MNLKEAESRGTTEPAGEEASARLGSGEVRITDVEFLGDDGDNSGFLTTGERCVVRMHYTASKELPSVTFGLGFVHESGVSVAGPNSGFGDKAVLVAAGAGHVDFAIDELTLQPATFRVTTAAVDRGHTYDYRDRAFELRVRARGAVTEPGIVRLLGNWQHEPDGSGPAPASLPDPLIEERQ